MSPQLLWTIAGLILTVLTLGGVTISSYQSQDAAKAKLAAAEIVNLATAAKLWLVNDSPDGSYTSIETTALGPYIPDLVTGGSNTVSKAITGYAMDATYLVYAAGTSVEIALALPVEATDLGIHIATQLQNKPCIVNYQTIPNPIVTYTCTP